MSDQTEPAIVFIVVQLDAYTVYTLAAHGIRLPQRIARHIKIQVPILGIIGVLIGERRNRRCNSSQRPRQISRLK